MILYLNEMKKKKLQLASKIILVRYQLCSEQHSRGVTLRKCFNEYIGASMFDK